MANDDARSTINPSNNNAGRCDTLGISTAPRAHTRHDAHRAIADEWLQRAIGGIKEMHGNEDTRKAVAQRLF